MFFLGFYKNGKLKNLANTFICKNGYNKYFSNWWPTRNGLITSIWSSSRISKMKKISKYRIHKNKDIYIYYEVIILYFCLKGLSTLSKVTIFFLASLLGRICCLGVDPLLEGLFLQERNRKSQIVFLFVKMFETPG